MDNFNRRLRFNLGFKKIKKKKKKPLLVKK